MKRKKALNLLLISSIVSLYGSCLLGQRLGAPDVFGFPGSSQYMWIMLLFVPIPIVLLIFSFKYKRKEGLKTDAYIIGAIVLIGLFSTFILGSGSLMLDYVYDDTYYVKAEEAAGIDLPDNVKVASDLSFDKALTYAKLLDKKEKEVFEKEALESGKWSPKLSSIIEGVLPVLASEISNYGDAFLVYNVTEDSFDISSFVDGEYEIIVFAYDKDLSRLIILSEFTAEIVK